MPLQATSGAASYDAFGGGVAAVPKYIEDYFSTFLYTGTGASQTITNGIDLSAKGGLVWIKDRSNAESHSIWDTARGVSAGLQSNATSAQYSDAISLTAYNSNGFSLGADSNVGWVNRSPDKYVSWSIAKAPKFFDVVTFSGDDVDGRAIPHNLGSVPGFVMIKCTSSTGNWMCWHNSFASTDYISLNTTGAKNYAGSLTTVFQGVSSTTVTVGTSGAVNSAPQTYVMYVFAHNAGGFGLTGTDNVISCGSFTANGSGTASVNLSYEPQWVMFKRSDSATFGDWAIFDNMRGLPAVGSGDTAAKLFPNTSAAENAASGDIKITSTGFNVDLVPSATYIYIAIRRGPMKVPTSATTVFQPLTRSGTGSATTVTSTVRPDTLLQNWRSGGLGSSNHFMYDRLRGVAQALFTDTTDAESTQTATGINAFNNLSYGIAGAGSMNNGSALYADYVFTRAPGFFDEVCYTGTGVARTVTHNLGVAPELVIVKIRSSSGDNWFVLSTSGTARLLRLNSSAEDSGGVETVFGNGSVYIAPTSTNFTVGGFGAVNQSGSTFVAYLFATCAGVSKCFNYTGNGSSQTINCGFTGGARWILIKRTDSTGDWYVWDSARGIVSGNDPHLSLNTTAAEVTSDDTIDTDSTGFVVNQVSATNVNVSSATYIGIAIA